ncbi:ribonuclease HI family protein [Virgibacillus sp. W0430]|uniref:ribonuclease HI family protein n=1 Tax=Virgibacillus sp. W0430 TaxID=3391580 RepID=UPI003F47221F
MIIVYTDGASNGNPGTSGAGIYMKHNDTFKSYHIPLGVMTNHEAEFNAVIHALSICQRSFPNEILSFRTDSKIVVDTIEKDYTRNEMFIPLLNKIREKASAFPYFFIKWIPEKQNFHADRLARQAIKN